MSKRLFEVRMEVTAFVEAEDEPSAQQLGEAALREEASNLWDPILDLRQVTHRDWPLEGGWDKRSLVYGAAHDTTLGSWLAMLPEPDAESDE